MVKKNVFFLAVLIITTISTYAQNTVDELFKDANVYYLDRHELPAKIKDSVYLVRVIKKDTANQGLFNVEDYYLNGHRAMVGKSKYPYYNIVKQGVFIRYFRDGHKKSVENFDDGRRTGDGSYYYPNGNLYYVGHYDELAQLTIIMESRDSIGSILATSGDGTHVEYSEDYKKIKGKGPIVNGLKQGKWSGMVNDTISYVCSYDKGISYSGVSTTKSGKNYQFTHEHVLPEFPGGEKLFSMFLVHNMHYPAKAKETNVQGKVFVQFVVNIDGKLTDFKVVRGPGGGLDEEAVRVLKLSPAWQPGTEYGITVRTYYTIPLSFTLQEDR